MKIEKEYNKKFKGLKGEEFRQAIEKDYWTTLDDQSSQKFKVNYAADLDSDKYGSGFPTKEQDEYYGSHNFNFNNLNKNPNSFLQFADEKRISGITVPWVYVGQLYSSFCWHYEDLMMYSINYMHEGAGKMWYAIPSQDARKFEKAAKQKLAGLAKDDPNFLLNINSMICPTYLAAQGVTVYSTLQKPGEIILTFPESYHAGFSVGYNCTEAVNFTCPTWLKWTDKAMRIYMKSREKVPVFPMQWIALENGIRFEE